MAYKNFKICCGKAQSTVVPGSITASHSGSITTFISGGWQLNIEATLTGYHYTASCRLEDLIPQGATFSSLGTWSIQVNTLTPDNPSCTVLLGRLITFEWDGSKYSKKTTISVQAVINYTQTVTTYISETFNELACNAANAGNDNGSGTISSGWTSELVGIRPLRYKHSKTMLMGLPDPNSNSNNTTITMNSFNLTGPASVMANKMITITPVGGGIATLTVSFENTSSTPTSGTYSYEYDYDWVRKETNLLTLKSDVQYINLQDYVTVYCDVSGDTASISIWYSDAHMNRRPITFDYSFYMTSSDGAEDSDSDTNYTVQPGNWYNLDFSTSDGYNISSFGITLWFRADFAEPYIYEWEY